MRMYWQMIQRNLYLREIQKFIGKPQVKIITGIRRSGKSIILKQIAEVLLERGIDKSHIISINFESLANSHLLQAESLYREIKCKIVDTQRYYLLFDEIQEIYAWEKAVNSFLADFKVDIYLTGSNSHLLSSELATFLAGRYVEIPVFTLSFSEFLDFNTVYGQHEDTLNALFVKYLRMGGFPVIHTLPYEEESANKVVRDIYDSVILRDSVQRHKIRDVELLNRVITYAINNIGNTFSGKNVADYFKSQQRKIDINTVYNYLTALESAFVLYRVSRFDLKGKEILKTQEKFYLADVSLLYATMGYKDSMISGVLENIVFLELKRRGFKVYVGKFGNQEIDFVCIRRSERLYIQVAYKLESTATIEREFLSLASINDHYPKYVVTMDEFFKDSPGGIKHIHITDFLMAKL